MSVWRCGIAALALLQGINAMPALASGGPDPTPLYIDRHGGTAAELARLYRGRLGVVMARSPEPLLYLEWRLLHGLRVGEEAGAALSVPCCTVERAEWPHDAMSQWTTTRDSVIPAKNPYRHVRTELPGPDYTTRPNCFPDAFRTAAATLTDRIASHGRESPAVREWVAAQDVVFEACGGTERAFPPAMVGAPAWLQHDRAYQRAAFALYNGDNADAASRFAAIAQDFSSPWQPMGLYLGVRAIHRAALADPSPRSFARARRVIATLARMPERTYGRGEARRMLRSLAYRDRPMALLAELDRELARPEPDADVAVSLRDYLGLARRAAARPDAADWILTLRSDKPAEARDHAMARWAATRDPAWLIAALALADPGDRRAAALAADAARVDRQHPAWLTAQYHLIRLTIMRADPTATRARLDAILTDSSLSLSDRNLFVGARLQVARNLAELARFALRRPLCTAEYDYCEGNRWIFAEEMLGRHGPARPWIGLGSDARAVIDRLPLRERIALGRDGNIPAALRLDIQLTNFARAVQLQDNRSIDLLAADLAGLLPQLRQDWRRIAAERPGPAKRFAAFFVMAKIPGLRSDLADYQRPTGTVRQFRGYWAVWMILPPGTTAASADVPAPSRYRSDEGEDGPADLTCLDHCGPGSFPLQLPRFVALVQDRAAVERRFFQTDERGDGYAWNGRGLPMRARSAAPEAVSLWDEALAYARANPGDPRAPELLYRLIRIARWGGNHDHLGRRAFTLLHRRYHGSAWAQRSPYYYDDEA